MGKNQSASGLTNIIQYDNRGNISFVSGSTTLMQVSSSGAITTTGVISGSSAQSASLAQNSNLLQGTGSVGFATTSSFATASGSISTRVTQIEQVYATTGSNSFRATQSITGSLTVTGQIVAQTINVQQVTSSIVFSSGSNTFGCDLNSRQTFTGSMFVTGGLTVNTTGPELQVTNNGVVLGNLLTDNHSVTGSLRITGSVSTTGDITIGAAGQMCLTSGDLRYTSNAGFGIVTQNGGRLVSIQNGAFGVTGAATFSSCVMTGGYLTNGSTTIGTPIDTGGTKAYFDASSINGAALTLRSDTVGRTLRMTSDGSGTSIGAIDVNSSGLGIATNTSHPIIFSPQAIERMRITTGGTVQPAANGTQDLGTSSLRWATVYTSDLSMSNGIGDYTIVEGEEDLFLYNNKKNRVFKFVLAEVDPSIAPPKKS